MKVLVWIKDTGGTPPSVVRGRMRWLEDLSENQYTDLRDSLLSLREKGATVKNTIWDNKPCIEVTFRHVTPGLQRLVEVAIEFALSLSPQRA